MQYQLQSLSNQEVSQKLTALRREEKHLIADILVYLGEVERRGLHLEEGYSSMFDFCTRKLGYSESGANRRITAFRAIKKYGFLLEELRYGNLTLESLSTVSPLLTPENCHELSSLISGKTRDETRRVVSELRPQMKRPEEKITPLHVVVKKESLPMFEAPPPKSEKTYLRGGGELEERFELSFSVTAEVKKKLGEVQLLLSGKYPRGVSLETMFEELLDEFLKKKAVKAKRQSSAPAESTTRHIPAAIRRAVMERDGGSCTFEGTDGVRCGSRWDIEVDHVVPFAAGGEHTLENLRVLCRSHNMHQAKKFFGDDFIEQVLK